MPSEDIWDTVQRVRTYEQVMAQIETRILDGRLKAGDRLPSERELAGLLGVSRPSLRETLRVLEALGIIEIRSGGGPEGGAVLVDHPGGGFVNLLKMQLALGHFDQSDVLQTRLALETWCCAEAATQAKAADCHELEKILDAMDNPSLETSEFNRLDTAFHVRIAESTSNALTSHLMRSLRIAINRQMIDAYAQLENWTVTAKSVCHEHRQILDAIQRREPNEAKQLVEKHIRNFYRIGNIEGSHS